MNLFLMIGMLSLLLSAQKSATVVDQDGAWCWFTEPRAVAWQGTTYTGWVNSRGDIVTASINSTTHAVDTAIMYPALEADDHANPSYLMWPDGRLYCFFTAHGSRNIHMRVMNTPNDMRSFSPVKLISNACAACSDFAYPCPLMLPAEDSAIYVFCRGGGLVWNPHFIKSVDKGINWSETRHFISSPNLRPYFKFVDNGKDEIHVVFTDGHPRETPNNSVYYARYRANALYRADGTRIKSMDSLPLQLSEAEKIYDASLHGGARAWVWDIALDSAGRPVVAYVNFPSYTEHRYRFIRWDGTIWRDQELINSGRWFPQTPPDKIEPESQYSGGIQLDHTNPFRLFLSRQDSVTGVFGIERWLSLDQGVTWKKTWVAGGQDTICVRPIIPRGTGTGFECLYMKGEYVNFYGNYKTSIRMAISIDTVPPEAPSALQATTQTNSRINLSWNAPVNAEPGVTNYEIYRGKQSTNLTRVKIVRGSLSITDTATDNWDTLYYAVKALNGNDIRSKHFSNTAFAVAPVFETADLKAPADTLSSFKSTRIRAYVRFTNGLIDSSGFGISFSCLDTALLSVTPDGYAFAMDTFGTARIVATRGSLWLNDTCRIVITKGAAQLFIKRFDFRCNTSFFRDGWIPENGAVYDSLKGYGWSGCSPLPISSRCDRAGGELLGTFVMITGATCDKGVFRVNVPDGFYIVRIGLGDATYPEPLWVLSGTDTIARFSPPGNLGNGYSVCDDTILVSGGKGASFRVGGALNAKISYLIMLSKQGIAMEEVADDGLSTGVIGFTTGNVKPIQLTVTPNPFNPKTQVQIVGFSGNCAVQVYSAEGKLAVMLELKKGKSEWNASRMSSGLYIIRAHVGRQILWSKVVLLR